MAKTKEDLRKEAKEALRFWTNTAEEDGAYDIQPIDFMMFINEEVWEHISKKGQRMIIDQYKSWME